MSDCSARPSPDGQIRCARCRLVWDKDDNDPPLCPNRETAQHAVDALAYTLEGAKQTGFVSGLPDPV